MKFYTRIPESLAPYFDQELVEYKRYFDAGQLQSAWHHLERAHIIGQAYPYHHSYVHWKMLLFGIHIKNTKEVIGQIPRLLVGGVKSFVGHIPVGNTGGADVPPLMLMDMPHEIREIFKKAGVKPIKQEV
ncbi:MAG: hypothetical protein CL843_06420 [Crocinitomicaceae bacterium]|jgi:hypothetical protein|uniref:Uncharacterized protein DUF3703 n=1 Tax=Marinoscillum furvescens DSM 4134 TaxID=1122208 RepID=A0A3D9KZ80_MARFU|nr:DUF3703 domain-containing protein [Marinoscillum furvescens]MAX79790.1 hypothetical protein [Crocinitomicaceae bacterium]RED94332.1 uncharacterized protein DUF3703 [Marinoscillum furvescens DSM 4134]|tara:strand:- start:41 stop:430 length:390 start_codon:yes stop_codon:yes gene_type:complete